MLTKRIDQYYPKYSYHPWAVSTEDQRRHLPDLIN